MRRIREEVDVQRFSAVSYKDFHDVVADLQSMLGHVDLEGFARSVSAAPSEAELERIVRRAAGSSGFIEFARFDLGAVLRKRIGDHAPRMLRILLGNPLIMAQMARHVPDVGSYTPVSVLIDERADGVHLSYDRIGSLLAPYGNSEALRVAQALDAQMEALLTSVAQSKSLRPRKMA
jgi:uncharacterized protein (DUF302 family)